MPLKSRQTISKWINKWKHPVEQTIVTKPIKKYPEKKIGLINPDLKLDKDYWGGPKIG